VDADYASTQLEIVRSPFLLLLGTTGELQYVITSSCFSPDVEPLQWFARLPVKVIARRYNCFLAEYTHTLSLSLSPCSVGRDPSVCSAFFEENCEGISSAVCDSRSRELGESRLSSRQENTRSLRSRVNLPGLRSRMLRMLDATRRVCLAKCMRLLEPIHRRKKQTDFRFLDRRIANYDLLLSFSSSSRPYLVQTEFDKFDNTGSSVHCYQDYNSADGGGPLENDGRQWWGNGRDFGDRDAPNATASRRGLAVLSDLDSVLIRNFGDSFRKEVFRQVAR